MFRLTTYGLVLALVTGAAMADPVENRRAAMDQIRFGAATMVPMLKGEAAFNAPLVEAALRASYAGAIAFEGKFPEGSSSKGANPAIWENMADFEAKLEAFQAAAKSAVAAKPQDLEALKAAYQPMLQGCAGCHELYRIKD